MPTRCPLFYSNIKKIVLLHWASYFLCWQLTGSLTLALPTADDSNEIKAEKTSDHNISAECSSINVNVSKGRLDSEQHGDTANDTMLLKKHRRQILTDLNKRIKEHPGSADNYFRKAFILCRVRQYDEAMQACDQATKLGLDHADIHLLKGEILFAQKKYNAALAEINKSLSLNNNSAKAYALLAEIQNGAKEYAKALQNISKAINLDQRNAHYYEVRADLDYKVEQYLRCIKDATEAIALNQNSKIAYSIRSKAYAAVDDPEQAEIDAIKAKKLPSAI